MMGTNTVFTRVRRHLVGKEFQSYLARVEMHFRSVVLRTVAPVKIIATACPISQARALSSLPGLTHTDDMTCTTVYFG